jgi:hypothetical protein
LPVILAQPLYAVILAKPFEVVILAKPESPYLSFGPPIRHWETAFPLEFPANNP